MRFVKWDCTHTVTCLALNDVGKQHQTNNDPPNHTNGYELSLGYTGIALRQQGANKIIFTACHLGKLRLAFTSPDVISTSPQNFLTSRIDVTVLLLFEFLKKVENNGAVVYVGHSLIMHNKLTQCSH